MYSQYQDYYDIDNDFNYVEDLFPKDIQTESLTNKDEVKPQAIIESLVDDNNNNIDICKLKKNMLTDENVKYIHIFLIVILVIVCISQRISLYTNEIKLHTFETMLMALRFNDIPKTSMT